MAHSDTTMDDLQKEDKRLPLMDTARKLVSGSILRVLNLITQLAVSMVMLPFVVGSLGDRMYGFWALAWSIIGYYGLLDIGISAGVSRHLASAMGIKDYVQCNRIISNALALFSGVAALVMCISIIIGFLASFLVKTPEDADLFCNVILVLGFNVAIEFPAKVFTGVLTAQFRYDIMSVLKLATLILRSAGIVIVLSYGHGVLALSLVTVVAGMPEKITHFYLARHGFPQMDINTAYLSRKTVRMLYGYGIYAFLVQIGDMLRFNVDSMVIASFLNLAAVTHYGIAATLTKHFMNFIITVMGVMLPVFSHLDAENDKARMKKAFYLSTKISICIASFVGFGLIVWGKFFIERWMGPEYLDAYPCLVILVVCCTTDFWQSPSVAILFGISKHKFYAIANGAEAAANLALSLLLVRWYGIIGVALGTMIPMLVIRLLIQPIYVCRVTNIPFREYFLEMGRTLSIVCVSLIIPGALGYLYGAADYKRLLMLGVVSGILYLVGIWMFAFKPEETRILKKSIMPK
jgi:O-antigen/teichoic acid export membrane protein